MYGLNYEANRTLLPSLYNNHKEKNTVFVQSWWATTQFNHTLALCLQLNKKEHNIKEHNVTPKTKQETLVL